MTNASNHTFALHRPPLPFFFSTEKPHVLGDLLVRSGYMGIMKWKNFVIKDEVDLLRYWNVGSFKLQVSNKYLHYVIREVRFWS